MGDQRIGLLLACIGGAGGCSVPNPLFFIDVDESTGAAATGASTTGLPGTTRADTGTTGEPGTTREPDTTGLAEPVCGNGVHEAGEQCDDGNDLPGDDCENNCRPLFRPGQPPIEGTEGAVVMALADLDGDGDDDIVLGGQTCLDDQPCVVVWDNRGDGDFVPLGPIILSEVPVNLFVADWSGDGAPDILAGHAPGFLSLIVDGVVEPQNSPNIGPAMIVARVNDDAVPDLLIPDPFEAAIYYMLADGPSFLGPMIAPTGHLAERLAAADVDHDGVTDILYTIAAGPSAGFAVKLGVGGDELGPFTSNASHARAIAVGEFAAPPWPNVVFSDPMGDTLQVFNNQGDGHFEKMSDTIDAEPGMLRLLSIRLNTEDVDNIIALAPTALQIFTYGGGKIVAGPSRNFSGVGIDVAAGALGGGPAIDLAVLTTTGVHVLINQSGE